MNPLKTFFNNFFAKKRIIGDDVQLNGLVKVDALVNRLISENKVPGLSIVVKKNGKTLYQKGVGYADLEKKVPIDAVNSIFRIASVSKPVAATALAQMVYDGLIDLDASFYKYVPYYPKKKWDFTIRQLASHTAGIRGYQGIEYGLNKPYSIKESIAIFKDDELLFEPGTDYLYNSFDWVLISLAMQEVSGIAFETYVKEKVLYPLQLRNTFTPSEVDSETLEFKEKVTKFYAKNRLGFREAIPVNNNFKLAGGGYLSTADDIAKLGQAYLDGKILDQYTLKEFLTSEKVAGGKTYYGLGWQVSTDNEGRPYYGHVGNGVGGYSNFYVYPEEQMVFVILSNCTNPNIQVALDEIIEAFFTQVKTTLIEA